MDIYSIRRSSSAVWRCLEITVIVLNAANGKNFIVFTCWAFLCLGNVEILFLLKWKKLLFLTYRLCYVGGVSKHGLRLCWRNHPT